MTDPGELLAVLSAAEYTLTVHGHIDRGTPLHDRITSALARAGLTDAQSRVGPVDRAVFGILEGCPDCGGQLAPTFGEHVDDAGTRRPVMDPTTAMCRVCGTMFKVRRPLTVIEWAQERLENTERLAAEKTGAVRAGWLSDAAYWREIVARLHFDLSQR